MTIIVEGPDGSGKSELAKQLRAKGYEVSHHGLYPDDGEGLLRRYTESILSGEGKMLVLDRCFLSEAAYGNVMRGEDRLGTAGRILLTRLTRARGVTEVLCLPPREVCRANWKAKTDDYVDREARWDAIYDAYELMYVTSPHLVRYNYLEDQPHDIPVNLPSLPEGCLGSPDARWLVVGEMVNPNKAWVDLPFYEMKKVSAFLNGCLAEVIPREEDLALVNAVTWKGQTAHYLAKVVSALPRLQRIIALGKTAEMACENMAPMASIPHPNFWLRFHYKERETYVKMLKEACR